MSEQNTSEEKAQEKPKSIILEVQNVKHEFKTIFTSNTSNKE